MNSMQIKAKLKNISSKKNIDFNTLLRLYMYDRFLERLSISKFKDNFIIKGGFYLSTLFGVESRTTNDIDTAIKDAKFTQDNIEKMIKSIINLDINDGAKIIFNGISTIREDDEYGGYRVNLCVCIENMKENFQIDIATGDPITPFPLVYKYYPILSENYINIWTYNLETVISEKLETILKRSEANGRTRDFYDLYLIYSKEWDNININHLKNAVKKTFAKRSFNDNINDILIILKQSEILRTRWEHYSKKYEYAQYISYEIVMNCIEKIISEVGYNDSK